MGYAPAHAAHFSVKADGTILQSRDTAYQSAANLDGNHRVIAIENEDHGPAFGDWSGSAVPALTDAQVEANARILRWAHETHGIPMRLCPNSRPASTGLAYHRQGIDGAFDDYAYPGRVTGGETWTEHYGKVCPGDRRIAQLPEILVRARGEEDDMPLSDQDVERIARAVRKELHGGMQSRFQRLIAAIRNVGKAVRTSNRELGDALVEIADQTERAEEQ